MKGKTTLILLLLAVVALGAFLSWDRDRPGSEERRAQAAKLLPDFDPDTVVALDLVTDGGKAEEEGRAVRLRRTDAAWLLAEPRRIAGRRADGSAVDELLAALAGLTPERELIDAAGDQAALAELGLAEPRASLRLEREAAPPLVLEVGGDVPASETMVVRVATGEDGAGEIGAGDARAAKVYVVGRTLLDDLRRAEWRERKLFPYTRGEVVAVTLDGPEGSVELARRDGGPGVDGFEVRQPYRDIGDDDQIASLFTALSELTAEEFVDDVAVDDVAASALAGLGLDPPLGTLTLRLAEDGFQPAAPEGAEPAASLPGLPPGPPPASTADMAVDVGLPESSTLADAAVTTAQSVRIEVGTPGDDGRVHLRLGEQVVVSHTLLPEVLAWAPADWASRRLTEHRAFEITGMVVEDAEGSLDFTQKDGEWSLDGEPMTYLPLSDLLNAVTEARAEELRRGGSGSGGLPGAVVRSFTLRVRNGVEGVETVRIHAATVPAPSPVEGMDDDRVVATVDGRDAHFLLGATTATEIDDLTRQLRATIRDAASADSATPSDPAAVPGPPATSQP